MAHQASLSPGTGHASNGNGEGIVGSIAEFGNDLATLVELQAKLAAVDGKEATEKAAIAVVGFVVAVFLVIASFTIALFGVADLIARAFTMLSGWAMVLTALLGLVTAGGILFFSTIELKKSLLPFRRSREEFVRNVTWLRTVLVYSRRPPPRHPS